MQTKKTSAQLKTLARTQLYGKYASTIGAFMIARIIIFSLNTMISSLFDASGILSDILFFASGFLVNIFNGLFISGMAYMYLNIACNNPVTFTTIFYGFKQNAEKAILIEALLTAIAYVFLLPGYVLEKLYLSNQNIVLLLINFILVLIGLIVTVLLQIRLSMCFYLLQDFPDYTTGELIKKSFALTKHQTFRILYIELSFIPYYLLTVLTCGLAYLWIQSYRKAVLTNLYLDLIRA